MSDIVFKPWGLQKEILRDESRTIFCAAGRRSGKTEICAIKSILFQETKRGHKHNSIDPFIGVIIAPTHDMLRRLSLKKFLSYAKPFIKQFNKSTQEITWHDDSLVYGISAEKPQRLEGIKANWIWIDEVLQCPEQIYLESMARVSDQEGFILLSGSLGPQFINPKNHWCYKHFKENNSGEKVYEWTTLDNPHFPKEEHAKLKATLNPSVFRSMFEINWDTKPLAAVFPEYDDNNLGEFSFNPNFETYISVDWGYANDMAVLFIQYDRGQDIVYILDEICQPRITVLDGQLWSLIISKADQHGIKNVKAWICDIAGLQEREQTGISNVMWFKDKKKINFLMRRTPVLYGLSIMRNYIQDGLGRKKLVVHKRCNKLHDQLKMYRFNTKNGEVLNENPVKKDDHGIDSCRYFFINVLDDNIKNRKTRSV